MAADAAAEREIARLQRQNEALADALLDIYREMERMRGEESGFDEGWAKRAAEGIGYTRSRARTTLELGGLLPAQYRPELIPEFWKGVA